MIEKGYGKIVNISSSSIFRADNRIAHYVSAKMGVVGLTRALAREYSDAGVTINALSPGPTDSGSSISSPEYLQSLLSRRSIKRIQKPKDVSGAMLFLSSHMSDFMTGQHLIVDGGAVFQ
jgi:NAD(P)-dependent dehydrogenase (short-subunit alcohol dehydrogenase family)